MKAPLSYSAALKALRWAVQTPWKDKNLKPEVAQNYTLHSLKVTLLSAAAQLRLPLRARELQGHHRPTDSAQLYSRDDTVEALSLQNEITKATRNGWRPVRPMQRGAQTPVEEPGFVLPFKTLPDDLDLPLEQGLQMFQQVSSLDELTLTDPSVPVKITDTSDSDDSMSSCSTSSTSTSGDQQEELMAETNAKVVIQNGPAGCCHAARKAHITRDTAMTSCGPLAVVHVWSPQPKRFLLKKLNGPAEEQHVAKPWIRLHYCSRVKKTANGSGLVISESCLLFDWCYLDRYPTYNKHCHIAHSPIRMHLLKHSPKLNNGIPTVNETIVIHDRPLRQQPRVVRGKTHERYQFDWCQAPSLARHQLVPL